MFDYWHEKHVASLSHDGSSTNGSSLGPEYVMNDAGDVSLASGASSKSGTTGSSSGSKNSSAPAPTLVGSANGLEIDLIWDSSVANAPSGFMQAVIDAAEYYTTLFSTKEVINIEVGWGEIAGSTLASNALGESKSLGYLTIHATVTNALEKDGYTFSATNEPTTAQFFANSVEAKAWGLISGSTVGSSSLDGYIGFSTLSDTGYSWNFTASAAGSNTGTGSKQFDLESVALHEISEVMGRIGMEGETVNGKATYTPLDLFNFQSPGVLELSSKGGYFSVNDGTTNLGTYSDASAYRGNITDWASYTSITQSDTQGLISGDYDAYDAFTFPGYNGDVSQSGIIEDAALGYTLTAAGKAAA